MMAAESPVHGSVVTQRLLGMAAARGSHQALADARGNRAYSYARLAAVIEAAASGLAWRGLHPRDVVGVQVPDAVCYVLATHAIRAAGGVPSPVAAGLTVPEIAGQLADCGARMLLTAPPLAAAALAAADRSWVRQVISFGDVPGAISFDALIRVRSAAAGELPPQRPGPAALPAAAGRLAEPGRADPAGTGGRADPACRRDTDRRAGYGASRRRPPATAGPTRSRLTTRCSAGPRWWHRQPANCWPPRPPGAAPWLSRPAARIWRRISHCASSLSAADARTSGGRFSYGVLSTIVVRVDTFAAARISWSMSSSAAGEATRTFRM